MIRDFGVMKPQRTAEKCLDSQLWHACAGGMVQIPPVNSKVIYFPQGHAEHSQTHVEFGRCNVSAMILCKISAINYLADPETDEVYSKIRLTPLHESDLNLMFLDNRSYSDDELSLTESSDAKPAFFAKTLTQSDANNGGGFSVPRYCADTIFPRLDYSAEPPVQTILAKDFHGETWKFRHIYRGTPRRHLLTTGWSSFVNQKKLVAGDSIVFLRADNGELCVGIRRAKRGIGVGHECPSGWNSGFSGFLKEDEMKMARRNGGNGNYGKGKVKAESVIEAASLAANGQPFEVVYYPSASSPEFFVRASAVRSAMQTQWCPGMRFKMPFETEDSSRISWFMGTISSVQVSDPIRWPKSPWRLLQVAWDEPDLLHNVKRVSPWLVEQVSNMPAIHLSPFSPPRKKLRLPQHQDLSIIGHFPLPSFPLISSNSPLCSVVSDPIPARGIQGARHFQQLDRTSPISRLPKRNLTDIDDNISCLLSIGSPAMNMKESCETKGPHIFLFGQLILPGQHSSGSCSGDTHGSSSSSNGNPERTVNSSDEGSPMYKDHQKTDRALDVSTFGSFEELRGAG